ncbi:MAG TPA: aldo/keto reductase [Acidimicrobiales bacterium]|nr:aldo/keto reductase [Acidimicrobiales bacterium]
METRAIGSLQVTVVGIGCNNFGGRIDAPATQAVVDAALDAGINLFDTADIYGGGQSEVLLGQALGDRRDQVVIATKFGMGDGSSLPKGASATSVAAACEGSLRRLGTDRIDLYQLHAPDGEVPQDETLEALDRLVREGKVREIGCSNFGGDLVDEATTVAAKNGTARYVSVQNELSLVRRGGETDLLAACERNDLVVLPYFPLASGLLTGKYRRGEEPPAGTRLANLPEDRREKALSDKRFDTVEALEAFASERGHTLLELAMSWLAGLPHLASVIAGATRPDQVKANAASVGWQLTAEDRAELDRITPPR